MKTGEVVAVKRFAKIAGDIETAFRMANGAIVNAAFCDFDILEQEQEESRTTRTTSQRTLQVKG